MKIPFFDTVGTAEALFLMRNLTITLRAGVPLARALKLFEQEEKGARRKLIAHLRQSVESGHPLAQAMETAPRTFPPLAVNLVRAGEVGGTLEESLEHIAKYIQKSQELRRKIRGAMMYPSIVLVAVVGLGLSIGTFVLPKLLPLFQSLDVELPWSTRVLLWTAAFFEQHGIVFLGSVIILFVAFLFTIRLEIVKPFWHRFLLAIPYLGMVQRQAAVAHITATLSTLLRSGVPISAAIEATAGATDNRVFRRALSDTLPIVEAGHKFSDGLSAAGRTFPSMAITLVALGEETGTFADTLEYLSGYYEEEVDYTMKNLSTALEPMLLVGIGLLVGFTVLSILTPIYNVTGLVS